MILLLYNKYFFKNLVAILMVVILVFFCNQAYTQVSGKITGPEKEPLTGASVIMRHTSKGATTNKKGEFSIASTPDRFELVISYVGLKTVIIPVEKGSKISVSLEDEILDLEEVVIKSNENPAIPIILKTMQKRKELESIKEYYETHAYTKGVISSPRSYEKFLKMGMIDSTEVRDSSGRIIMYLAETLTDVKKIRNDTREYVLSSRRSGDPKGLAMNFVQFFKIDLTQDYIDLSKRMINPIGTMAFQYYNYHLEGSYYESGQKIYKIKVTPKRSAEPVFTGSIYIADDYFTLSQVDLFSRGSNLGAEFIDTLFLKQSYVKINNYPKWLPLTQMVQFKASMLGFEFEGSFLGMFQEYKILPENSVLEKRNTIVEFDPLAAKKPESYWDTLRPIALTTGESGDYKIRDSIAVVQSSPAYLDSIDRKSNRFKPLKVVTSYTYRVSKNNFSISTPNFLSSIRFDPVMGFSLHPAFIIRKGFEAEKRNLFISLSPIYGFAEDKFRYAYQLRYAINKQFPVQFSLNGGHITRDYNSTGPISQLANSIASLFGKINYAKFYDLNYLTLGSNFYLTKDLRMGITLSAQQREPLVNHTDYSFYKKDRVYQPNYPVAWPSDDLTMQQHEAFISKVDFRFHPGTTLIKFPESTTIVSSDWPIFQVELSKGFGFTDHSSKFSRINFNILDISVPLSILGNWHTNVYSGIFLGNKPEYRQDYAHFAGNLLYIKNLDDYNNSFKNLSYYKYSTNDKFIEFFSQWDMKGFLFKKIPLLNKTGFEESISLNALWTPEHGTILEPGVGITRIGFGAFRFFRFDYFWTLQDGKLADHSFVVGVNLTAILGATNLINR